MKRLWWLSLAVIFVLAGCGKSAEVRYLEGTWKTKPEAKDSFDYKIYKSNGTMKRFSDDSMDEDFKKTHRYTVRSGDEKDTFIVREEMPDLTLESTYKKLNKDTMINTHLKISSGLGEDEGPINIVNYRVSKKHWWNLFD